MRSSRAVALAVGALVLLAACDASIPSGPPTPTPGVFADRPAISIDSSWRAQNGRWTFTGQVDPNGAATDVVLDIGPGPQTLRQFDTHVEVAKQVMEQQALTITTDQIPDIPEICVRFTATNSVGSSVTSPLCVPHDRPTFRPPATPTARVDDASPAANGQWAITGYVDPMRAPTDVVLDVGTGPATAPTFTRHVPMTTGMTEAASLEVTIGDLPASGEVCVRVTATNSVGTTSSAPRCFAPAAPS